MRHYEIVFMVYPEKSDQVPTMIDRYSQLVKDDGGHLHRLENWGRRPLSYEINGTHKAHYVLMNIEVSQAVIDELAHTFRYNDTVMRHLIIRTEGAITEPSPMMKAQESTREQRTDRRGDTASTERTAAKASAAKVQTEADVADAKAAKTTSPTGS